MEWEKGWTSIWDGRVWRLEWVTAGICKCAVLCNRREIAITEAEDAGILAGIFKTKGILGAGSLLSMGLTNNGELILFREMTRVRDKCFT